VTGSSKREFVEPASLHLTASSVTEPSVPVPSAATGPVVNSHNEWDLLEEVIVGLVDDAMLPEWDTINRFTVPAADWEPICRALTGRKGRPYPEDQIAAGRRALDNLVKILEGEGVRVRRPDRVDYRRGFATPAWSVSSGFSAANPRDVLLVIGNEIIEAPMADRSRFFEAWAYRSLLKEYFRSGAKWTAAPHPQLIDELYDADYAAPETADAAPRFVLTEFEPTFDAAEFMRCGRDLFTQLSHVTNRAGIAWLERHLGDDYRIHILESRDPHAIHLDSTFVPLAPGKVLVNPEYLNISKLPAVLKNWDILVAPQGTYGSQQRGLLSEWIHLNVLSIDAKRVIVESSQQPLMKALRDWGFEPIPCAFAGYYPFVGSFHCATLDIRRRGTLESYA
jgi:glycine amidinotransferase